MRKVSEVLQLAKDHPSYLLVESDDICNRWLCGVIHDLCMNGTITGEEVDAAGQEIYESIRRGTIQRHSFLREFLENTGVIEFGTRYTSKEYHVAAHQHWANLISKLQEEGK
jgi:hypothetical protein